MEIPAFYQMASFAPLSVQGIEKKTPSFHIQDLCSSPYYYRQMRSYFDVMSLQRVGMLQGEYTLICDGNLLVSRDGAVIRSASAWEEPFSSHNLATLSATVEFMNAIDNINTYWDKTQTIESPAVLSGMLIENYFHFSLEIVPRLRHFPESVRDRIVVGERALRLPFQTSLLSRAAGGCTFLQAPQAVRVRDPILAHDALSEDGVHWLRRIAPRARRGGRNLYIRRGARSGRTLSGGGLEETSEILDVLKAHNFEIIEFGSGHTLEAQVAMLEGAGLILAAHGAALTNIAYLEPGVAVLELIGAATPRAVYMHLCSIIGLDYQAILTDRYSESRNLRIDPAILSQCISDLIAKS